MNAINTALADLQSRYDARLLAPTLLIRAARLYSCLVAIRGQDPEQLPDIFALALAEANREGPAPAVITTQPNLTKQ